MQSVKSGNAPYTLAKSLPNTTKGYRVVLFLKSDNFGVTDLARWPRAQKTSNGYIIRLGTKNWRYFVHSSDRRYFLALETDDTKTQLSAIREIGSYARGMGKTLDPVTLDKSKALDFVRSLEQDGLYKEGKLHVYFGDTVPFVKGRPRTKIVFNNRNIAEAKSLSDRLVWGIRGISVTLMQHQKKHFGLVFFDDSPTAKVTKTGAAPTNDDLHEELADRLVKLF
jgi:hypothetical protein